MNPLHTYLSELHAIHASGAGVKETSYYPAVSGLFNAVGKTLKPGVHCIINLKNTGAGIPDGGFFTPDQMGKAGDAAQTPGLLPSRGVLEVKGTGDDVHKIAASEQVDKYWTKYRQVLVTNMRDFVLVGRDETGQKAVLETFSFAPTEATFWTLAAHPEAAVAVHGERFIEYVKRVLLHAAPLATPEAVAWFLASYARDAKSRIETAGMPALAPVRAALEEALGLKFEGGKGDHFFRSTLVQTLFYGIFSAWVLWSKKPEAQSPSARFHWKDAAWELHVPMIRALFEQVAQPSKLGPLGLVEVLEWTGAALNRVDRPAFFASFDTGLAVQYFYEPFLQAFDPELRRDLGVWYTPPEIVRYQVARVDAVLRDELDIPDGLADPRVYVLDPCCGTGAYLVEVLKRIHETLESQGGDALVGSDLKKAATERVFGFEILPAPFVVAHLQLGLLLQNAGAPLSDVHSERAGVFLTNALTGWEPAKEPKSHLLFPELEAERDAADQVKQAKPILVILGNPPYNSFAGVAVAEERALSTAYRTTKTAPAPQGQGLNDLYIRFFRMAERRITEGTGKGIVCFISNYSWLDGLSFTGMRERFTEVFDQIWVDNLHGDRIISEYAPDGKTSETVFALEGTSVGIKVGTAISLLVKKEDGKSCHILYRDADEARAADRRAALLESIQSSDFAGHYKALVPVAQIGLPFKPRLFNDAYLSWPLLPDVFPVSFPGVKTSRDDVVVDIDRARLEKRMTQYFDPAISHEQMKQIAPGVMEEGNRFSAIPVREVLQKRGILAENIVRYCYRPFDVRWLYWEPETKLLDEKRSEYVSQVFDGNYCLVSQQKPRREWSLPQFIMGVGCLDLMDRCASCIPLLLRPKGQMSLLDMGDTAEEPRPNLSERAREYLRERPLIPVGSHPGASADPPAPARRASAAGTTGGQGVSEEASGPFSLLQHSSPLRIGEGGEERAGRGSERHDAESLFYHTLAILHTPAYRAENGGALRQDWPRLPLPDGRDALEASAALGRQVAALLDTETAVPGVTIGTIRAELRTVGVLARVGGGMLQPAQGDLRVTAGWGHGGQGGVTMPGKGRSVERDCTPEEQAGWTGLGEQAAACLGGTTRDVFLNGVAYWKNVPARVWDYTIGGYQVMKKWLSYREAALLGRDLTPEEAQEVRAMARRIAALLFLEPALDANYQTVKAAAFAWGADAPV